MPRWTRLAAVAACLFAPTLAAASTPQTGRVWLYGNFTALVSPNLSLTVLPGVRYELERSGDAEAKRHYLDELFIGPNFSAKFGDLSVKASLWYYYTGYPNRLTDTYESTHNLELVPAVEYKLGRWTFADRVILHNTFYASVYEPGQRFGYGLVARNLLLAKYAATENVTLLAGVEPFLGVIEDRDAKPHPIGYWQHGLRLNRVYAGFDWKATREFSLSPQYVYETAYDLEGRLAERGHYLFVTASYVAKLFE